MLAMKALPLLAFALLLAGCTAEASLKAELDAANHCATVDDCVMIGTKCPFDCFIYVHKDSATELRAKVDAFQSTCEYSCIAVSGVECRDQKCVSIIEAPNP